MLNRSVRATKIGCRGLTMIQIPQPCKRDLMRGLNRRHSPGWECQHCLRRAQGATGEKYSYSESQHLCYLSFQVSVWEVSDVPVIITQAAKFSGTTTLVVMFNTVYLDTNYRTPRLGCGQQHRARQHICYCLFV